MFEQADKRRTKRVRKVSFRGRRLTISGDPSAESIARAIKDEGGELRAVKDGK